MEKRVNKSQAQQLLHYFLFDPNIYVSVVMTLKKKSNISTNEVKLAIEKAYTQNETTISKVVLDNGEAYFENMSETGCKVYVDNRNWIDILNENEKKTFKINEGELIRSFITDGDDEISIFIMAHHIVGDGSSLVIFAQDILSNLAGEEVEYKALNNEGIEPIPSKIKYPFKKKFGIKLLNGQWKKTGKVFDWADYYNIHEQFWKNRQTFIETTTIEEEELLKIKDECKKLGITMNSYIVAKQLEKAPENRIIGIPASYRGSNKSLCNIVAAMKINYTYNTDISFEENAKEIHKIIKDSLEDPSKKYFVVKSFELFDYNLVDGALMARYAGYNNDMAKKMVDVIGMDGENKTQLGVTNLAKINLKSEYDTFKVQDFEVHAASMSTTKDVVSVCTLDNRMKLCSVKVKKD